MLWSFNFRENPDVLRWRDWGRVAYLHNLADTYKPDHITFGTLPNNLPPGMLYAVYGMYLANLQTSKVFLRILHAPEGGVPWINDQLLNAFLRIPSIMADLGLGALIYLLVSRYKSKKAGLFSAGLFLFSPVVLYNSAFWGQRDAINNLFFYIGLFFILRKRTLLAAFFFLLSLYMKFSLVFMLPFFFIALYFTCNRNIKRFFTSVALGMVAILIFTLPISSTPHIWFWDFFKSHSFGEMCNMTVFAFNAWWLIFRPSIQLGDPSSLFTFSEIQLNNSPEDSALFFGIPLFFWAMGVFLLMLLPLGTKIWKLKDKILVPKVLFPLFSLTAMIAYLFLPRMHERYMYPVFPLLATYLGWQRKFLWVYVMLTFLNWLNLYLVWHPWRFVLMPYELMNSSFFQWLLSLATVTVAFFWYKRWLKVVL